MTVKDAFIRGNNLVMTAIVALAGFAFTPEMFLETEHAYKADEGVMLLLGIGSIVWYLRGKNRFTRSIVPVLFVAAALVVKLAAIFIEFKDKEDVGDDFGALVLFVLATIFSIWLYIKSKHVKES